MCGVDAGVAGTHGDGAHLLGEAVVSCVVEGWLVGWGDDGVHERLLLVGLLVLGGMGEIEVIGMLSG